jgi:hypothetical protein
MGEREYVPAMVAMPHLSTAVAFRTFGALGTKRTTGFQPVFIRGEQVFKMFFQKHI